ncbi:hypothetical protein Ancab_021721 [Ancistrocladus abbreviatus]
MGEINVYLVIAGLMRPASSSLMYYSTSILLADTTCFFVVFQKVRLVALLSFERANKEIELKKAAAKGSKAEQKARKKLVEEEILKLSEKLKEKHTEELASLVKLTVQKLAKVLIGVNRRLKRKLQGSREYKRSKTTSSVIEKFENEKLEEELKPLGLTVNEVKPDGHCLYQAIKDQLVVMSGGSTPCIFQKPREMVAACVREHSSDFLPFFLSKDIVEGESDSSLAERFENYCREVESTTTWGGRLELGALTHCLRKHIMIYSVSFPDVEMGKEYKSDDGSGSSNSSIMLSYHRHAFGLVILDFCYALTEGKDEVVWVMKFVLGYFQSLSITFIRGGSFGYQIPEDKRYHFASYLLALALRFCFNTNSRRKTMQELLSPDRDSVRSPQLRQRGLSNIVSKCAEPANPVPDFT